MAASTLCPTLAQERLRLLRQRGVETVILAGAANCRSMGSKRYACPIAPCTCRLAHDRRLLPGACARGHSQHNPRERTGPPAARTARLRLVKGSRTVATGKAVLSPGRLRVRLRGLHALRAAGSQQAVQQRERAMSGGDPEHLRPVGLCEHQAAHPLPAGELLGHKAAE